MIDILQVDVVLFLLVQSGLGGAQLVLGRVELGGRGIEGRGGRGQAGLGVREARDGGVEVEAEGVGERELLESVVSLVGIIGLSFWLRGGSVSQGVDARRYC